VRNGGSISAVYGSSISVWCDSTGLLPIDATRSLCCHRSNALYDFDAIIPRRTEAFDTIMSVVKGPYAIYFAAIRESGYIILMEGIFGNVSDMLQFRDLFGMVDALADRSYHARPSLSWKERPQRMAGRY